MEDKKKKKNPTNGAFGWFQGGLKNNKETSGYMDVEKNIEVFNHNMGNDSNSSSEGNVSSAVAEAYEDIKNNPETVIEAMAALDEMEEEFISQDHLDKEYDKHVLGKEGKKFAYFKDKGWSKEDYEAEADRLQNIPVDKEGKGAKVKGFVNQDGSRAKYFPNDKDQSYVFYRQYKDGSKKTISYYSMRGMGEQEYNLRKMYNKMDKKVNPDGPDKQRDLRVGESYSE